APQCYRLEAGRLGGTRSIRLEAGRLGGWEARRQEEWIAAQKGRTARGALRSRIATLKVQGRAKLEILALHFLKAAKRIFGIPDFRYYALADGIKEVLSKAGKGKVLLMKNV
ncbi:MAG: hypothetical protein JSV55_06065, partial [Deltaproteobacteria bacterium]